MTMFVRSRECETVRAAALVSRLGQLCAPRRWSLGQVEPSGEQGRSTDFRGRHHLLQRWWGAAGVAVVWPASPGRGLGEEGHRSNQPPPSPGQARAFPEPVGGRARLELPSRVRWVAERRAGERPLRSQLHPWYLNCGGSGRVAVGKTGPGPEVFPESCLSLLMPSRTLSVFRF